MMIAVVPARGGSKGILRKNMRLMKGRPLIYYVLRTLKNCSNIDGIVVTSDEEEILEYASQFEVMTHRRPDELASDFSTLDPVVIDAVRAYESSYGLNVETVITVQPTSPLLSVKTLGNAIEQFRSSGADCLLSVSDDTHLAWRITKNGITPLFEERVNRQWLPRTLKETGAIVICKRRLLDSGSRIGGKIELFEVPTEESIDIDNGTDWLICSCLLEKMNIDFVVVGAENLGLGHVRRALTLANYWLGHNICFIGINLANEASSMIREQNYPLIHCRSLSEVTYTVRSGGLIINDVLDTDESYISSLKTRDAFIVNFEDLGDGADQADLVINALYERTNVPENHKYGYEFECLDERFLFVPPNDFNEECQTVLITFGGTDPSNLTFKTVQALQYVSPYFKVKIVLGPAFRYKDMVVDYIQRNLGHLDIEIHYGVDNMARIMKGVDLAITSNGRTLFEVAAMGIPALTMAQNERETMHLFAKYSKGVRFIGIGDLKSPTDIAREIENLVQDKSMRRMMYNSLPIKTLRSGLTRVTKLIETEFRRWKDERDYNWK